MNNDITVKVRRTFADVFNLPREEIKPETSPDNLKNWDSLQHLNLVLALEQDFGVRFNPEEIENLENVAAIEKLVGEKLAGGAG